MIQTKEKLIQEIEQAPDSLIEEVLNYLLFKKSQLSKKSDIPKVEFIRGNNFILGLFAGDPDQMEAVMHFIGSDRIKSAIESLPQEDFQQLRVWFAEKDWLLWDKQLEADVADGKLDFLLEEAMAAKSQGTLQDL